MSDPNCESTIVTNSQTDIVEVVTAGPQGVPGPAGPAGQGVPAAGTTGQVLAKASATDYATEWVNRGARLNFSDFEIASVSQGTPTVATIPETSLPSVVMLRRLGSVGYAEVVFPVLTGEVEKYIGSRLIIKSTGEDATGGTGTFFTVKHNGATIFGSNYELDDAEGGLSFVWNGYQWFLEPFVYQTQTSVKAIGLPNQSGTLAVTINSAQAAPATPTSSGLAGSFYYSDGFFYVCVDTNQWRRMTVASWT